MESPIPLLTSFCLAFVFSFAIAIHFFKGEEWVKLTCRLIGAAVQRPVVVEQVVPVFIFD